MTSSERQQPTALDFSLPSFDNASNGSGSTGPPGEFTAPRPYTPAAWPAQAEFFVERNSLSAERASFSSSTSQMDMLNTFTSWPSPIMQLQHDSNYRRSAEHFGGGEAIEKPDTTTLIQNQRQSLDSFYYYGADTIESNVAGQRQHNNHVQRKCHIESNNNNQPSDSTYIIARRPSAAAATAMVLPVPPDSTTTNGTPTTASLHLQPPTLNDNGPDSIIVGGPLLNRKQNRRVSLSTTSGSKQRKPSLKSTHNSKSSASSSVLRRQSCLAAPTASTSSTLSDDGTRISASVVFAAATAAAAAQQQQQHRHPSSFYSNFNPSHFYNEISPSFASHITNDEQHLSVYPPPDYSHLRQRHNKQQYKTLSASPCSENCGGPPPNVTITPGYIMAGATALPAFSSILNSRTPPNVDLLQHRRHSMAVHPSAATSAAAAARRFSTISSLTNNNGHRDSLGMMLGNGVDDDEDNANKQLQYYLSQSGQQQQQQQNIIQQGGRFLPPSLNHSISVPAEGHISWCHRFSSHDESNEIGGSANSQPDDWTIRDETSKYSINQQQPWQHVVRGNQQIFASLNMSVDRKEGLREMVQQQNEHQRSSWIKYQTQASIDSTTSTVAASVGTNKELSPEMLMVESAGRTAHQQQQQQLLNQTLTQQALHNNNIIHHGDEHNKQQQQIFPADLNSFAFDEVTAQLSRQFRLSRSPSLSSWIDRTAFSNIIDYVDDNTTNQHTVDDLSQLTFLHHDTMNMLVDDVGQQHHLPTTNDPGGHQPTNAQQIYWLATGEQQSAVGSQPLLNQHAFNSINGNGFSVENFDSDAMKNFTARCSNAASDILVPVNANFITHSSDELASYLQHHRPSFADEWQQIQANTDLSNHHLNGSYSQQLDDSRSSFPLLNASLTQQHAYSNTANLHEALVSSSTSSMLSPTTTTLTNSENACSDNNSGASSGGGATPAGGGKIRGSVAGSAKTRKMTSARAARDARKDIAACRGAATLARSNSDIGDLDGDEEDLSWLCTTAGSTCGVPVTTRGSHLWEFIRDILLNPKYCPKIVKWENRDEGVFRFVESEAVAKMWGNKKCNPRMTYEKLSRAMRTYYSNKILVPVPKTGRYPKKLVYKFGPNAFGWQSNPTS